MNTGLVLGGGGARGWAHIGVLKALDEAGVHVDCVCGTSIGALVGAVWVSGKLTEFEDLLLRLKRRDIARYLLELSIHASGLIDGRKVLELLEAYTDGTPLESWAIPFRAVATDIATGEQVVLGTGAAVQAVRASISVPGMFTTVPRDGRLLVDGGLVNPVPVSVAHDLGAERIIAVDINYRAAGGRSAARKQTREAASPERWEQLLGRVGEELEKSGLRIFEPMKRWFSNEEQMNIFDVLGNSLRIMENQLTRIMLEQHRPDLLIRPELGDMDFMDFHCAAPAIEAGYQAGREALISWNEGAGES